ncbi:MAG: PorP/SprF family type IX secretion system membrane protein [Crocinitomicaceae bacterium]|tara:strand:- start:5413 stop:6402 length:990 start_codon:yes stop_codon:yes gene_type:complete
MKKLLVVAAIGLTSVTFGQQLSQYSQYNSNQFMVNPGAAGMYDFTDITIGGRYQWAGFSNAPMTAYAYGSTVLTRNKARYNPSLRTSNGPIIAPEVNTGKLKHALGGQFITDQYGAFRKISFAGTYAIHLPVTRKHNLSFGTKIGLSNSMFLQDRASVLTSMPGYTGPSINDSEYDAFIANQSSLNFLDIGAGFYFYSNDMYIGISADQLTRDMVKFGSGTVDFDPNMHFNFTAGYKIPLNDNLSLMPSALIKYMPRAPLTIEGAVQLEYNERFWLSTSYRHADAVVVGLGGVISNKFKFGYSFDMSLSKFNKYSFGGHELILGIMLGR